MFLRALFLFGGKAEQIFFHYTTQGQGQGPECPSFRRLMGQVGTTFPPKLLSNLVQVVQTGEMMSTIYRREINLAISDLVGFNIRMSIHLHEMRANLFKT